jgi:hypothetical protein
MPRKKRIISSKTIEAQRKEILRGHLLDGALSDLDMLGRLVSSAKDSLISLKKIIAK